MTTFLGSSLPRLPSFPGSGVGPGGWTMWPSNPSPGPAHRPLGTRPTAITTLSSGPAARAGVLQTGGRDPTGRGVVNEKVGSKLGQGRP